MSSAPALSQPLQSLLTVFCAWKGFLLAIALGAAVGSDYDTSTSLFFERLYGPEASVPAVATRLTRWDALYYMHAARDGYVYEQEWAFGTALPIAVGLVMRFLGLLQIDADNRVLEPVIAIAIAHISHLLAVLILYKLTMLVSGDRKLAFVASVLHILSPGGLFLSAPYTESPSACLSFLGTWLFALSVSETTGETKALLLKVGAGLIFGAATAFRSNGILNGLLFAVDAVLGLPKFLQHPTLSRTLAMAATVLGGLGVAAGSVIPQAVAWQRYCNSAHCEGPLRPWCENTIPSIYTFVQAEYWNVGFLRYWTLSQLPLFLLASPVLSWLLVSGMEIMREPSRSLRTMIPGKDEPYRTLVRTLAASQVLLGVMAITHYHVQIITRLSSGYAVLHWFAASCLLDKKRQTWGTAITVFVVMYGAVQGVLFASFLPPA